mgnify:CR=1 FL=1
MAGVLRLGSSGSTSLNEALIEKLKEENVSLVVNPGADMKTSRAAIKLAEKYDFIYAAVGIHPHDVKDIKEEDLIYVSKEYYNIKVKKVEVKINKLEIKDKTISLFHDIYIVEDDFKNKKLIKYVKGKRRPKKAIKDVYLALLKISHKNIISIYDVIESDDDFFVIMEYFDGINLNQYIKREFYPSEKPRDSYSHFLREWK